MEYWNINGFVLAYCAFSLCCFCYWYKKNRLEGIYKFALVAFLPVFGYLLLFFTWLWRKYVRNADNIMPFAAEKANGLAKPVERKRVDLRTAVNIVPVEEALLINSNSVKRKMVLNILRNDIGKYPRLLKIAMTNEDSETSHYAAIALMETKRKMTLGLQDMKGIVDYEGLTIENLVLRADIIKKMLESFLLDEENMTTVRTIYKRILERIIAINPQGKKYFIERINCDIDTGDYQSAMEYCQKMMIIHNKSEESLLMYLKISYLKGNKKEFFETLSTLEKSPAVISEPVYGVVEYWNNARVRI